MTIVWAVLLIFTVLKGRMFRAVRDVFPALAAAFALWAAVSALASHLSSRPSAAAMTGRPCSASTR